ncbi:MAG: thioredoxin [Promethearchaeota archaeon]
MDEELRKIRLKKAEELLKLSSMPRHIVNITSAEEFDKIINDYPNRLIIIDFWATWCGPCRVFAPIFEKLQQEYANDFIFLKVNVDAVPAIASRYRVSAIPTTLFIKNREPINKVVGAMNYNTLKGFLEKLKNGNN